MSFWLGFVALLTNAGAQSLYRTRETDKIPRRFFLARKAGFAYLQVPKVGCTSFKCAIALANRPELAEKLAEKPTQIHVRPEWNDMAHAEDRALAKLFKFTFVRHPTERFLSFYLEKVFRPRKGFVPANIAAAGFTLGMTLDEVLARIEETPLHQLDHHVLPQSVIIYDGARPRVDFIGRLERAEDFAELSRRTGETLAVGHHNRGTRKESPFTPTPEQQSRIEAFYMEDFIRFGYKPWS